jgi:predicted HicB family RNase H-like nuclease
VTPLKLKFITDLYFYVDRFIGSRSPGICTDAESIEEGIENIKEAIEGALRLYLKNGEIIPEPIKKEEFKGNIAYRTTSERHYYIAKIAKDMRKSISKTLDDIVDSGIEKLRIMTH